MGHHQGAIFFSNSTLYNKIKLFTSIKRVGCEENLDLTNMIKNSQLLRTKHIIIVQQSYGYTQHFPFKAFNLL